MKILLVEDTRSIAAVMCARLKAMGHEVALAVNGREAVERFPDIAPDLVLMDIEMPEMNGFEAVKHIRAYEATHEWAWTPVIFLTASDSVENLVQAIEAGGDDYLTKMAPEAVLQAKMKALGRIVAMRRQLIAANHHLKVQAQRDGLTGLCNRRYMDQRCDEYWKQAISRGECFGLMLLDVDHFKRYNDRYGHQAGDDCLRAVAQAVDGAVAEASAGASFAARYGGEEFAVILPGVSAPSLHALADAILMRIRQLGIAHADNVAHGCVTASLGAAWVPRAEGGIVNLFRQADANLYQAKSQGRNRAVISELSGTVLTRPLS